MTRVRPGAVGDRVTGVRALWAAVRPGRLAAVVGVAAFGVAVAVGDGAALERRRVVALLALPPVVTGVEAVAGARADDARGASPWTAAVALLCGAAAAALIVVADAPASAVWLLVAVAGLSVVGPLSPLSLAGRGLGVPVAVLYWGFALPGYGAAAVGRTGRTVALTLLPFALLVVAVRLEAVWPRRHADAYVGHDTLAVRWSPRWLRAVYAVAAVAAFGALVALTDGVVPAAPDVFSWSATIAALPAMPVTAWGVVRFTRRRRPYPAAVAAGLVAALQSATWAYAALG